tara:strand:- start:821 stop:1027 length:207 start_codon:yes stop_codon:yes gene_type:complete
MFKAIIIIGSLAAPSAIQIDDNKGPYATTQECYFRTAQMIKQMANKTPVAYAVGVCIRIEKPKVEKNV